MSEKQIIAGSDTIHGQQFTFDGDGVPFHNGKKLTATKVGLTEFELLKLSEKVDAGEVIEKPSPITPDIFSGQTAGLQIHAAYWIFGMYIRMASEMKRGKYVSPREMSPFQPPKVQALFDSIFWNESTGDLFAPTEIQNKLSQSHPGESLPPYFFHAYESFRLWQNAHSFEVKIATATESLYGDSGVMKPGVREKYWYWEVEKKKRAHPHPVAQRVLSFWYSLQLQTMASTFRDPLPDRTKALYETPMQLYTIVDDGTAAMISWIRPDEVVLFDSGAVKYIDNKSPSEMRKIPEYDDYDWLQIILSCIAAWYLSHRFLEAKKPEIVDKPPTYYVLFSHLKNIARLATAHYQFPEFYNEETGMQHRRKMEISDEQLDRSLQLYEYLIRKYAVFENKNRLRDFKSHYDPEGKAISPTINPDAITSFQKLLMYSPLSSAFLRDLSRLSDEELAVL